MDTEKNITNGLAEQWLKSGISEGDIVLVHSSLRRLIRHFAAKSKIKVTPNIVYESLVKAVGESGTIILPLFNFDFPQTGIFDVNHTPSQMGALTEVGRLDPESVRTGHPIYSFAVRGKHADKFSGVDNPSGYGPDSPFALIKELQGKIAVIGLDDQNSMTSYHFVEEQNQVDYRYYKNFSGMYTDFNGQTSEKTYQLYVRDIERGVKTDVNRMMDHLWNIGLYKGERPDEGYGMRTIDFNDLYSETDRIIKSGRAKDYLYSIEK
ncbi:AAC(3) family N-acetyltransferase [Neolewinella litorea]|uniref:Aminoglycoside N(3)-acetyltransferase n=1 Tax=Neolewinella litorea TaxID=2562452 RepID=A0A4S4NII4_9BACT|nr:AAC(3) family N-acetyltransferase [Neolewinella litorea]THH39519.1 AAC(3) family N-acetyltransferase [Neolewinella litorea]